MAQVALQGSAGVTEWENQTSVNINTPAGVTGDRQLMFVTHSNQATVASPTLSGWTKADEDIVVSGALNRFVIYHRTLSGNVGASTVSAAFSGQTTGMAWAGDFNGLLPATISAVVDASWSNPHTIPATNAVSAESLHIVAAGTGNWPRKVAAITGYAEQYDDFWYIGTTFGISMGVVTKAVGAGAVPAVAWNLYDEYEGGPADEQIVYASIVISPTASSTDGSFSVNAPFPVPTTFTATRAGSGTLSVGATDTITVTLLDQLGAPIQNASVSLGVVYDSILARTGSSVQSTNASGQVVFTVTGMSAGITTATASYQSSVVSLPVVTFSYTVESVATPASTLTVTSTALTAAIAAANAAGNGAKNAAYIDSLITSIGNYKIRLRRNGVLVADYTKAANMTRSGSNLLVATDPVQASIVAADIDTGTWSCRIEKSTDTAVYIEGACGPVGSGASFILTGDLIAGGTVAFSPQITMVSPQFDTTTTTNSVATILSDMNHQLAGLAWSTNSTSWNVMGVPQGHVVQGTIPTGNRVQSWWSPTSPYRTNAYWTHFLAWFVVFEMANSSGILQNSQTNTRIEFRGAKCLYRYRNSTTWLQHGSTTNNPGMFRASLQGQIMTPGTLDIRVNTSGNAELFYPKQSPFCVHGTWPGINALSPVNLAAVFVTVQARLVKNDPAGSDDTANAKYLLQVGGDWYPNATARAADIDPAGSIIPGIGAAGMKQITSSWQAFSFATISGAGSMNYVDIPAEDNRSGVPAITNAEFSANPPPLD